MPFLSLRSSEFPPYRFPSTVSRGPVRGTRQLPSAWSRAIRLESGTHEVAIINDDNYNNRGHFSRFFSRQNRVQPDWVPDLIPPSFSLLSRTLAPTSEPPSPAPAHPIREVLHDQSRHGSQVPLAFDSHTPKQRLPTTFTPPHWAPPSLVGHMAPTRKWVWLHWNLSRKAKPSRGRAKPERLHSAQAQILRQCPHGRQGALMPKHHRMTDNWEKADSCFLNIFFFLR